MHAARAGAAAAAAASRPLGPTCSGPRCLTCTHPRGPLHPQAVKDPSAKAIPPDAWGMLLTCQGNKDKRAVDEARLLFEEVGGPHFFGEDLMV
jgi:hypothetical protein